MASFLHVCTQDWGGAGIAANRLHQAMLAQGIDSTLLVRDKVSESKNVVSMSASRFSFLTRKSVSALLRRLMFRDEYCVYSAIEKSNSRYVSEISTYAADVDVIILHWIANFLSDADIDALCQNVNAKVVWYALDMAPFTGGCHYAWSCTGYQDDCSVCPAARFGAFSMFTRSRRQYKQKLFSSGRIMFVAPNHWVRKQISKASLIDSEVPVAYIPISPEIFNRNCQQSRADEENRVFKIFFGYKDLRAPRKGVEYFIEALDELAALLSQLEDSGMVAPLIMLPGTGEDTTVSSRLPFRVEWVGNAANDRGLASLYGAADCFVNASIEDSGPLMVPEALMTGTPVVSFDTGIAGELIKTGTNGYLVPQRNSKTMAASLLALMRMSTKDRSTMSANARESVRSRMDAAAVIPVFESLLLESQ